MSTESARGAAAYEFSRALSELRQGNPALSLRELSRKTGYSKSTISDALRAAHLPRWPVVEAIVNAAGGDPEEFREKWGRLANARSERSKSYSSQVGMGPVRCILSYALEDERELRLFDVLKKSIEYWARSNYGRSMEVSTFFDSNSLQWGDDWGEKIASSLAGTAVFVPLVSFNYLQSAACREEFLLYYSAAKSADMLASIVPGVLIGQGALSPESSDLVTRILADTQYVDLQPAVLDGSGSSAWRRVTLQLTERLVQVVEGNEALLGKRELDVPRATKFDEDDSFAAQMFSLSSSVDEVQGAADRYAESLVDIEAIGRRFSGEINDSGGDTVQVLEEFARVAEGPVRSLANISELLEEKVVGADSLLRRVERLAQGGHQEAKSILNSVTGNVQTLLDHVAQLESSQTSMNALLGRLIYMELASAALRKALRPLRVGTKAAQSVIEIVKSWTRYAGTIAESK